MIIVVALSNKTQASKETKLAAQKGKKGKKKGFAVPKLRNCRNYFGISAYDLIVIHSETASC